MLALGVLVGGCLVVALVIWVVFRAMSVQISHATEQSQRAEREQQARDEAERERRKHEEL